MLLKVNLITVQPRPELVLIFVYLGACAHASPTSPAKYGCDAPLSLITSAVEAAAASLGGIGKCPDLILITGDLIRHGLKHVSDPLTTMQTAMTQIQTAFNATFGHCPNWSPILAVGNNDLFPRYPAPPPVGQNNSWLSALVPYWDSIASLPTEELNSFRQTGFYSVNPWPGLTLLVLHTNYWDASNHNADGLDPAGGFAWLNRKLKEAAGLGNKVWITGHIPLGIDHFSEEPAWITQYQAMFQQIVTPAINAEIVTNIFYGHEHTILNRAIDNSSNLASFMHGSISPIYNNNPSFRRYNTTSFRVIDFADYFMDLSMAAPAPWQLLYSSVYFSNEYGIKNVSSVASLSQAVAAEPGLSQYANNSLALAPFAQCSGPNCPRALLCDIQNLDSTSFQSCIAARM